MFQDQMDSNGFVNMRWQLTDNTLLSISHWTENQYVIFSVGLIFKGKVIHPTVAFWRGTDESDLCYKVLDYASKLVEKTLGEVPERFYRDNLVYSSMTPRVISIPV